MAPSRIFSIGPTRASFWYWAGAGLVAAGLFETQLLPCVDYPQHLALAGVGRRLFAPDAPEHAAYTLNVFTYNGLFHLLVAALSKAMPLELAGRIVVAGSLLALAGAVLALVRALDKPDWCAALFTPALFSFSAGWGFVNYVLATAIAAWALVFVVRSARHPTAPSLVAVGALGLACASAHVLAMLVLCAMGAAAAIETALRSAGPAPPGGRRVIRAARRAALALAPLLAGCLYCLAVYRRQYEWDPGRYRDPALEGTGPPLWKKAALFTAYTTGLLRDVTDQILVGLAIALVAWVSVRALRSAGRDGPRPGAPGSLVAPLAVALAGYLATPMVLVGTHLVFPRLGQWVVLGAVLAVPQVPPTLAARASAWALRLGAAAGLNLALHCAAFEWETHDASAVIDDLPEGRAATAVVWEPETRSFRNGVLTHLAGYYGARKQGSWSFSFARYLSVPVRFRPEAQPRWPARGWEGAAAAAYDPRCHYARAFPIVIVAAPADAPRDERASGAVRELVFARDAAAVRLLSHHGRFWAFDTTGLPDDGER
ncbi:MAG TPA: hypothetical protein VE987_10145 [Polyangiaceae bacterium]|nr:hypothetical protein [Polyangiaceae bacterium]